METCLKDIPILPAMLRLMRGAVLSTLLFSSMLRAQTDSSLPAQNAPPEAPPTGGGFFPLSDVHPGLMATAWTVFTGTLPEPMQVEILGVLRGARGPGHDMILAQLRGTKPEYTGVVAGMSGSPVYIGNRLLGSLSFRIGQFSKDPIAGITPISEMLEVRDMPFDTAPAGMAGRAPALAGNRPAGTGNETATLGRAPLDMSGMHFAPMETPLVMAGFSPEAVRFWQQQVAGTGLEMVAAGGMSGTSEMGGKGSAEATAKALKELRPGSAVSAQLVRGDLDISATCTVTYLDPKQLLACGHPILQSGPVSLPMTSAEVLATLASPLNAFKIINTGATIGAFNEDRDAAIRGVIGAEAHMIPVEITLHGPARTRKLNVEVLDHLVLTPQAVMVSMFQLLLQNNDTTSETSFHVRGNINLAGYPPFPLDFWASSGGPMAAPMETALMTGDRFSRIFSSGARNVAVRRVELDVEAIPRRVAVALEGARLVSSNIVHPGDTVLVEASIRPWQQSPRNVRIPVKLPTRLAAGSLRLLVSDSGTLDRTLDPPRMQARTSDLDTALAIAQRQHAADRIYVSLLVPEAQAGMEGQTLSSLPLSMASSLEPLRASQDASLNGESVEVNTEAPAGGVLSGFQVISLRIEPGAGLN